MPDAEELGQLGRILVPEGGRVAPGAIFIRLMVVPWHNGGLAERRASPYPPVLSSKNRIIHVRRAGNAVASPGTFMDSPR